MEESHMAHKAEMRYPHGNMTELEKEGQSLSDPGLATEGNNLRQQASCS